MGVTSWVLFTDSSGRHQFRELNGESLTETDPTKWGLHKDCKIILVLHQARFINAFVEGDNIRKW